MVALTESASRNFATCVVMMVLVFFFVGLRLYSVFFRLKQPLKGPDWLCLFAVSIFYTHCAIIIDCASPIPTCDSPDSIHVQRELTEGLLQTSTTYPASTLLTWI